MEKGTHESMVTLFPNGRGLVVRREAAGDPPIMP